MVTVLQEPMRLYDFAWPERFSSRACRHGVLCYFDSGDIGTSSDEPPLVLLHALGVNFTEWRHVAQVLAPQQRLIGIDLPGCGHSAKPRHRWQLSDMTEAVLGLLDELGLKRAMIAGHSFGGRIATELALRSPERVAGLLLLNSAGFIRYPRLLASVGKRLLKPQLVAPIMVAMSKPILGTIVAHPTSPSGEFVSSVTDRFRPEFAWDFAYHACPLLPALLSDVLDEIPRLRLPIEVVWGRSDRLLRYRSVESHLSRLPQVRIDVIDDCGHMPNFEQPTRVAQAAVRLAQRVRRA